MWYAKWNNKRYKILNNIEINKSSREVTYTDLTLDFSDCKIDDLPFAQQEVKIYNSYEELKFTGFTADYKLPDLRLTGIARELQLSLFSPRQMATKRTITIIRTATLEEIIRQALYVLNEDGFYIKYLNLPQKTVTIKLISRTIEEVLNYLSNKYSLYWSIDELKGITIDTIEHQFNKPAVKTIDINNYKKIKGFLKISPSVQNSDYANIINVKNARIFYDIFNFDVGVKLKNGDRIDFENPIDISYDTAKRIAGNRYIQGMVIAISNLQIIYNNNEEASIISGFNTSGEIQNGINIKNIATDDSSGAMFVLNMDSTFKNLATGITYKGEGEITINQIVSQTALRYANMKLLNWYEINKNIGVMTKSGQIEKILDVEQGWFTVEELIDYVRSTFKTNDKYTNQINLYCDKDNGFAIGDRIEINLPEIFSVGNFVITDIKETKERNIPNQYMIQMRNTNLLENYIDLFRSSLDIQENESQIEMEYVVEYIEEEKIQEVHTINFENESYSTLNFALK